MRKKIKKTASRSPRTDRTGAEPVQPGRAPANPAFPIVGVGASAGGLAAFTELLAHLPADTGMAFVLVQHLDPDHPSSLAHLLSRTTAMPVREVTGRTQVEPNHVYVIPPDRMLTFSRGALTLLARPARRTLPHSIDLLFESLAHDQKEKAIGVILSGTAMDGTLGAEAIKAEGGITFAQDATAKFDSMPRSAIASGCIDFVFSPQAIAEELARFAKHPYVRGRAQLLAEEEPHPKLKSVAPADAKAGTVEYTKIMLILRDRMGVDFSLYKPSTVQRRITRRMALVRCETIGAYARLIQGSAKETDALFSDLLIGVTSFFRNPEAFDVLATKAYPHILPPGRVDPVRMWVPGCSSGQEVYSLAMSVIEYAERVTGSTPTLQIFGTDLSETMLSRARHGLYARNLVGDLNPERLRRFFIEEDGGYRVSKTLREACVFARHNLVGAPPFSRMDLISCRNLLIYLGTDLHKRVLPTFHYALKPTGILFLGASESIGASADLFEPVDKKHKIYSRTATTEQDFPLPQSTHPRTSRPKSDPLKPGLPAISLPWELTAQREADRVALLHYAPPAVLIDAHLKVIQFRGSTRPYLEPPTGKAGFHVLKMAQRDLLLPLRAIIKTALKDNRPVCRKNITMTDEGRTLTVTLTVTPLKNLSERCFLISFEEKPRPGFRSAFTDSAPPGQEAPLPPGKAGKTSALLRQQARRIAELGRELNETRDYAQSLQEQHEAAHEEIQAASEELQSGNEELQSVNEEMETSKEELESTNEELITVNEEMVHRNSELTQLNSDLNNLQVSINNPIVVVGRDLALWRFTPAAEKLFNLLPTDLGRPIFGIKHNLDFPGLEQLVIEVMNEGAMSEHEVRDKVGRWYLLRIRPYLTHDAKIVGAVLALVDIDALKRSEQDIKAARDYVQAILRTVRDPLLILQPDLSVKTGNEAYYRHFHTDPAQTEGRSLFELADHQWNTPALRRLLSNVLPAKATFEDLEFTQEFPVLGRRTLVLSARRLETETASELILLSIQDVTEKQEARLALKHSETRFRRIFETAKDGILVLDPEHRTITDANPFIIQFLGYSREELLGKELWQLGLFKDTAASQQAFRELAANGFIRYEDLPLKTKTGEKREVEFVSNLYDEEGHKVIQCNIRDITKRKHTETALREAIGNLEEAQGAAERGSRAKDDFLAALSHELRTPLTPVLMVAHELRQDERLPADIREELSMIERNIHIEVRLIDDLLDLTKISHGKLQLRTEPCDMHHLINQAEEIIREEARSKGITIERHLKASRALFTADPARMQQVVWNLLRNAIKFTPLGGKISLHTRNETGADGKVWLRIDVVDTGIGIDPARLDQIFQPFDQGGLTGDHRFGGVGLGLAIAHAVIEAHGGKISAQSGGVNRGATLTVELPGATATPALDEAPARPAVSPLPPMTHGTPSLPVPLRLLLVEDHESTLQTLLRLLKRDGHHVVPASTVAAALAAAHTEPFDLVISDLGLPDGTGLELMSQLAAQHGLRGIALSGYGMEEDLARSREAGFATHLVKPIATPDLRRAIAALSGPSPA